MALWQRTAAWALLALAAAGAALPPLVLFLLKPKTVVRSRLQVTGQLPLDAFFLLDASTSVKPRDWTLALDFAGNMAFKLNASFPHFRAGLGQFSSHYQLESKLSPDLTPFRTLPERVQQLNGTTFVDKALCGNEERPGGGACSSGALADLTDAPALEGVPEDSWGCNAQEAAKVILLVTDGLPTKGLEALESARHLKLRTNVTLMGVLVGGEAANAMALYALTSCCAPSDMELQVGRPACRAEPNWTCPHMVRSTSYADLAQSAEWLATALTSRMECERVEEHWNTRADLRSLWFLLVPVPMLAYVLCLRLFVLCPAALPGGGLAALAEPEPTEETQPVEAAEPGDEEAPVPEEGRATGCLLAGGGGTLPGKLSGGKAGRPPLPGVGSSRGVKRWAPVRTAYIVAGQRLDVDYGGAKPPAAPNAARRGHEQASVRDTPEAYFANLDGKADFSRLTATLVHTMAEPAIGQAESPHPLWRCSVLVPLACTLALLPLVLLWSGLLGWHWGLGA